MKVCVRVKVLKRFPPEKVGQSHMLKQDVIVADHTASIKVELWGEHIDTLEEGRCYELTNFHVKGYQSKKHLAQPKTNFRITPLTTDIKTTVPDAEHTIQNVQILGIAQLDHYKTCMQCKGRVEPMTPPLGKCTQDNCLMIQLYDLCQDQISARLYLRYLNAQGQSKKVVCAASGDVVHQLADLPRDQKVTMSDLLKARPIHQVKFLTERNVITHVLRIS